MHQLKFIIQLLRPKQWMKNTFVFLPLFFHGEMLNLGLLSQCVVVFFAFSFAASSIYCFNDIQDVEADRLHPKKCKRPLASNHISIPTAYVLMLGCVVISMIIPFYLSNRKPNELMMVLGVYWVMNIAYCLKLKHYPVIDVIIIAIGFVLRVVVGGVSTGIELSEWIIIMTFLLSLFLAFAKRRDDVVLFNNTGVLPRRNTHRYNLVFLNQVMTVISTIIIIAYIMYTLSPVVINQFSSNYIYVTAIFVLIGVIRYLQVTIVDSKSGNPTNVLLQDRFIQSCIIGWVGLFFIIIYL